MKWGWTTSSNNLESAFPNKTGLTIISTIMANTVNTFLMSVQKNENERKGKKSLIC